MTDAATKWGDVFANLRSHYVKQMPEKIDLIGRYWNLVVTHRFHEDDLTQLARFAHSLAGAGKTYGYAEITTHAAAIEACILATDNRSRRGDNGWRKTLEEHVTHLKNVFIRIQKE